MPQHSESNPPRFVFATCQPGMEDLLKAEVSLRARNLRLSYSQPGLITWKTTEQDLPPLWTALEQGKFISKMTRAEWLANPPNPALLSIPVGSDAIWIVAPVSLSRPLELTLPEHSPSRSYLKLKEMMLRSGLTPGPGDSVLEIGCAPGGMSLALLECGAQVTGVDRGKMDPSLLTRFAGQFQHLSTSITALNLSTLQTPFSHVVIDMHTPPNRALEALRKIEEQFSKSIRVLYWNLKLGHVDRLLSVQLILNTLERKGFELRYVHQGPYHHREIGVVACRN